MQLIKNLMRVFALMGLGPLPGATGETAGDLDFLQDYASSIRYGLVGVGGFRRYNELTAGQNRYLY